MLQSFTKWALLKGGKDKRMGSHRLIGKITDITRKHQVESCARMHLITPANHPKQAA